MKRIKVELISPKMERIVTNIPEIDGPKKATIHPIQPPRPRPEDLANLLKRYSPDELWYALTLAGHDPKVVAHAIDVEDEIATLNESIIELTNVVNYCNEQTSKDLNKIKGMIKGSIKVKK